MERPEDRLNVSKSLAQQKEKDLRAREKAIPKDKIEKRGGKKV